MNKWTRAASVSLWYSLLMSSLLTFSSYCYLGAVFVWWTFSKCVDASFLSYNQGMGMEIWRPWFIILTFKETYYSATVHILLPPLLTSLVSLLAGQEKCTFLFNLIFLLVGKNHKKICSLKNEERKLSFHKLPSTSFTLEVFHNYLMSFWIYPNQ